MPISAKTLQNDVTLHSIYSPVIAQITNKLVLYMTGIIGSRPSDHYYRSVCLSVCLFVQSFSQLSLIRFRSN